MKRSPLARKTPLRRKAPTPGTSRRKLEDMTHGELEALLDAEVSLFVRATPAMYSRVPGMVQCFTCGTWKPWKELDCGHYIPRHRRGTRFDLRNLRPQCVECNKWREGEHWKFRQALVVELGEKEVQALELLASMWGSDRHSREWLLMEIDRWRTLNRPLRKTIKEREES